MFFNVVQVNKITPDFSKNKQMNAEAHPFLKSRQADGQWS
jgi:hypothetical protein